MEPLVAGPPQRLRQSIRDLSLQVKLLVVTLGMLGLLLAVTLATNIYALDSFEAEVSATRLGQEQELVQQHLAAELASLTERALAIALDESLLSAAAAGDPVSAQRLGVQLRVRYQLDRLSIVGRDEQVLFGGAQPPALAEDLGLALLTIERTRVVLTDEGALFTAAVPLKGPTGVEGALLIGKSIDDAFLRQINSNRSDPLLGIYGPDGGLLASSAEAGAAPAEAPPIAQAVLGRVLGGAQVEEVGRGSDGTPQRLLYAQLDPGGEEQLLYSLALSSAEIQAYRTRTTQQSVAIMLGLGLLTAALLVAFIRGGILGPLRRLGHAVERLGAGELAVELAPEGRDEIGRLSASFSAMASQLRQSFASLAARNEQLEHEIGERRRIEEARAQLQSEIAQAEATIQGMSSPIIPIDGQTLVMPLIGALDARRAGEAITALVRSIEARRARVAILDVTGVPLIDTQVAAALIGGAATARLIGARVVLTGIRPEVAQSIIGLGIPLDEIGTYATLQQAIVATRHERLAGRAVA